jgi:hypothetical protein
MTCSWASISALQAGGQAVQGAVAEGPGLGGVWLGYLSTTRASVTEQNWKKNLEKDNCDGCQLSHCDSRQKQPQTAHLRQGHQQSLVNALQSKPCRLPSTST